MATSDEIGRERQRVSEQLARLDAEKAKLANELNELEIAGTRADAIRKHTRNNREAKKGTPGKNCASGPSAQSATP